MTRNLSPPVTLSTTLLATSAEDGWTTPRGAVADGNIELVRILIDAGADASSPAPRVGKYRRTFDEAPGPAPYGRTAFQGTAMQGGIELLRILLVACAGVNTPSCSHLGKAALQEALAKGDFEAILILLADGADVSTPACPHVELRYHDGAE